MKVKGVEVVGGFVDVETYIGHNSNPFIRFIMSSLSIETNHVVIDDIIEIDATEWIEEEIVGHLEMQWDYTLPDYQLDVIQKHVSQVRDKPLVIEQSSIKTEYGVSTNCWVNSNALGNAEGCSRGEDDGEVNQNVAATSDDLNKLKKWIVDECDSYEEEDMKFFMTGDYIGEHPEIEGCETGEIIATFGYNEDEVIGVIFKDVVINGPVIVS